MLNRPSRHQTFMDLAHVWAKRATCMRLNVGAVIVVGGTAVSHGYNGAPAGYHHCLGNDCPGRFECKETIHAEDNALRRMPVVFSEFDKDIYVTDSPCSACCELLLSNRVRRVFFATPYRDTSPLAQLFDAHIRVFRILPAGYILDWETREIVELDR